MGGSYQTCCLLCICFDFIWSGNIMLHFFRCCYVSDTRTIGQHHYCASSTLFCAFSTFSARPHMLTAILVPGQGNLAFQPVRFIWPCCMLCHVFGFNACFTSTRLRALEVGHDSCHMSQSCTARDSSSSHKWRSFSAHHVNLCRNIDSSLFCGALLQLFRLKRA